MNDLERRIRFSEAEAWAMMSHPMMRAPASVTEQMQWMNERLAILKGDTPMDAITDAQLDNWFTYHSPEPGQQEKYVAIRESGLAMAKTIRDNAPACADTTAAIRKVREAVMTGNQAIACGGK